MPTNDGKTGEHAPPTGDFVNHPNSDPESVKLGYETTDVNVSGVIVFVGGLFGFVLIFFLFCFFMGKTINSALETQDGPVDRWHQGRLPGLQSGKGTSLDNLTSNTAIEQKQFAQVTAGFPNPRLDTDDGNQATADLHAREDLLLDHYSKVPGEQGIRIPITRAMELIAQKGLPVVAPEAAGEQLAGDKTPTITAPLTSGFARTGYELDTIEAREQRMSFSKAENNAHAELHPIK
jgi:hypothetical protein